MTATGLKPTTTPCSKHTVKRTIQISTHNTAQSLASLAKWLSVRLRTKWLWVRVPLQSFLRSFIQNSFFEWYALKLQKGIQEL